MSPNQGPLTVLVTGGAGFVGSHTVVELVAAGHRVIVVDSCVNAAEGAEGQKPPSLAKVEEITGSSITFYKISMLSKEELQGVFVQHRVDVVIHFAALKAVGESVEQPLMYYHNNITGTINLLEAMNKAGVKRLIYSSSATVYGKPKYIPIDENHPTGQEITNPYGQTKYMCEQIMKDITTADSEWQVIYLRYFNPVGAHESGRIGEDPRGIPNNLMPFVAQVAVGRRELLSVFGDQYDTVDGTGVRDYIHVVDLAKGHVISLKKLYDQHFKSWKAYNLGTGRGVSVLQLISAFERASGRKVPYKITAPRAGDVDIVVACPDLAKKELGWTATKSLEEMCTDSWRWQSNNPKGFQQE